MSSRLGRGRPQDWPTEMGDVADLVKAKLEGDRSVVLDRALARDVVTAIHVGIDALYRCQLRVVKDDPADSAYFNARTCICGGDAREHMAEGCDGFDPDWDTLREIERHRYIQDPRG